MERQGSHCVCAKLSRRAESGVSYRRRSEPGNDSGQAAACSRNENRLVLHGHSEARYAAGRLVYEHDSVLMAQRFDPTSGAVQGEAEGIAENVLRDSTTWKATFDVVGNAVLAYATGGIVPAQPMWYDRTGKELGAAGPKVFNLNSVRLSPDGSKLLTESGETNTDVWVYDLKRNVNTRLTFGSAGASSSPAWSPDGRWIAYVGVRTTTANAIYRKPADGGGLEELLVEGDGRNKILDDWSPDGKTLLIYDWRCCRHRHDLGRLAWEEIVNPRLWFKVTSSLRDPVSHQTDTGLPTRPRSPGGKRCMSSLSMKALGNGRSPMVAVPRICGGATAKNCFIGRAIIPSCLLKSRSRKALSSPALREF